jgi:hypothetical protein
MDGDELSRVPQHSIRTPNSDINLGKAAFGEIPRGAALGFSIDTNIWIATLQACSTTWNLGTESAFAINTRKAADNLDQVCGS